MVSRTTPGSIAAPSPMLIRPRPMRCACRGGSSSDRPSASARMRSPFAAISSQGDPSSLPSTATRGQRGQRPAGRDGGRAVPCGIQAPTGSAPSASTVGPSNPPPPSQTNLLLSSSLSPSVPIASRVMPGGAPSSSKSSRPSPARCPRQAGPQASSARARSVRVPKRSSPTGRVSENGSQSRATGSSKRKRRAAIRRRPGRRHDRTPAATDPPAAHAGTA